MDYFNGMTPSVETLGAGAAGFALASVLSILRKPPSTIIVDERSPSDPARRQIHDAESDRYPSKANEVTVSHKHQLMPGSPWPNLWHGHSTGSQQFAEFSGFQWHVKYPNSPQTLLQDTTGASGHHAYSLEQTFNDKGLPQYSSATYTWSQLPLTSTWGISSTAKSAAWPSNHQQPFAASLSPIRVNEVPLAQFETYAKGQPIVAGPTALAQSTGRNEKMEDKEHRGCCSRSRDENSRSRCGWRRKWRDDDTSTY